MKEKRKRTVTKKQNPEPAGMPEDTGFRFNTEDAEDPYEARLPGLVFEMRKEHEEVVKPKNWILFCILPYIPVAGAAVLFLAGYGKRGNPGKNIRNYAKTASWVSLAYSLILGGAGVFALTHMDLIRRLYLLLKGV